MGGTAGAEVWRWGSSVGPWMWWFCSFVFEGLSLTPWRRKLLQRAGPMGECHSPFGLKPPPSHVCFWSGSSLCPEHLPLFSPGQHLFILQNPAQISRPLECPPPSSGTPSCLDEARSDTDHLIPKQLVTWLLSLLHGTPSLVPGIH